MHKRQNMQTWTPVAFVLFQHINKGTRVLFHPGISLGFNREQQKQFAEPDIINSELKGKAPSEIPGGRMNTQFWRSAVGLLQFLEYYRKLPNFPPNFA
jgi:hypothetical protein